MTPATDTSKVSDQARELARREDWRAAVEALRLPVREARALRIAVMRERVFRSIARSQPRAAR